MVGNPLLISLELLKKKGLLAKADLARLLEINAETFGIDT